jgi:hypothetical protein
MIKVDITKIIRNNKDIREYKFDNLNISGYIYNNAMKFEMTFINRCI